MRDTDEIYDLVRAGIVNHLECNCLEGCIKSYQAVVNYHWAKPAAYRYSFEFGSLNEDYYAFAVGDPVVVVWDGPIPPTGDWRSPLLAGPCPGGSGGETPLYQWRLQGDNAESVAPGDVSLTLLRNGGTGTCGGWVEAVWENVHPFDPWCGNLFRPRDRGALAPYSEGLSCLICVQPAVALIEINCLSQTMTVPLSLGSELGDITGDAAHDDCCDPDSFQLGPAIVFEHDSGCVWSWAGGETCDQGGYTVAWSGEVEIIDAGGGNAQVQLTLTLTGDGSLTQTDTYVWLSAAVALAEVAELLRNPLSLTLNTSPGGTPLCTTAEFDDPLTLFPL